MSGPLTGDPFGAYSSHMSTHGAPIGFPEPPTPFTTSGLQFQSISEETAKKIASLQAKLNRKLGPEYISQRPGPGGGPKLTYVEGWKIINLANEVFGFNGWSSNIVNLSTDFTDYFEETKKYCIGVSAIVRVTLRDGVYHEDIGYGTIENTRSKGAGLDKCKKEAVTDGLKRALRNFGNVLGNCLYDKSYTAEIVKIKVEPPKFKTDELHRRSEFQDVKPNMPTIPSVKPQSKPLDASNTYTTPSRAPMEENRPSILRSEVQPTSSTGSSITEIPRMQFKIPYPPAHPITPAATPMHNPQQDKRVSFSKPPVPQQKRPASPSSGSSKTPKHDADFDSDDTFGLNDEEFLALADLVADVGRPIEEDDIGRPIDQEESLSTITHDSKKNEAHTRVSEQQQRRKPDTDAKKLIRGEAIAAALKVKGDGTGNGKVNFEQTTTVPTPGAASTPQPRPTITSSGSTSSTASGLAQKPHEATTSSMAQHLYQSYLKGKYPTDQNQRHQNSGSTSAMKTPPVPSMGGGFNFSSGPSMIATPSSSTPVVGVKRSAESMSTGLGFSAQIRAPTTSFKGGRPGMGLQQAPPTPRLAHGPVDVGDREDVKRIKL